MLLVLNYFVIVDTEVVFYVTITAISKLNFFALYDAVKLYQVYSPFYTFTPGSSSIVKLFGNYRVGVL